MKIALDPTPFHHSHTLLELPRLAADLGYKYLQLTPQRVGEIGFLDRDDTVSVFAEDDNALEVARFQLQTIRQYASSAPLGHAANKASV